MGSMYFKCNEVCFLHDDVITIERDCYLTENIISEGSMSARTTSRCNSKQNNNSNVHCRRQRRLQSLEKLNKPSMPIDQNKANLLNAYYINSGGLSHNNRCNLRLHKTHLETINERLDSETFTESNKINIKSSINRSSNRAKQPMRSKTIDLHKCIKLTENFTNKSKLENSSFRSRSCRYKCRYNKSLKDLMRNESLKISLELLTIPVSLQFTKVNSLFLNEQLSSVQISEDKLRLSSRYDVIYDLEMSLILQYESKFKVTESYWQLSQQFLKCYPLLPNDSKWVDKSVMLIPLDDINKIIIGKNTVKKLNRQHQITTLIQIYMNLSQSLQYNKRIIQIKYKHKETLIEVGIKSESIGIAFIKAISYIKAALKRNMND